MLAPQIFGNRTFFLANLVAKDKLLLAPDSYMVWFGVYLANFKPNEIKVFQVLFWGFSNSSKLQMSIRKFKIRQLKIFQLKVSKKPRLGKLQRVLIESTYFCP